VLADNRPPDGHGGEGTTHVDALRLGHSATDGNAEGLGVGRVSTTVW
jgi:hypothetical protein